MVEVITALLGISFIMFFGIFAEGLFRKTGIPDVLFLILLGFALGPNILGAIDISSVAFIAPVFTTFTLIFLMYDGAFNIELTALARGFTKSFTITFFYFIFSAIVIASIMFALGYPILIALLVGCILGEISSVFVIPVARQLKISQETYSILTLESAITDVLCITTGLAVTQIILSNELTTQVVLSNIVALFAVGGLIGLGAAVLWIFIHVKFFRENKSYMVTIAYLLVVYVITEFLGGNGAIAALTFGLIMKNSKSLSQIVYRILDANRQDPETAHKGIIATTGEEEFFYSQISFLLKTFFFVYIGLLVNIADTALFLTGTALAAGIFIARKAGSFVIGNEFSKFEKQIMTSMFARGLAAAAIVQIVASKNVPFSYEITNITYSAIILTIIMSSANIFIARRNFEKRKILA